MERGEGAAGVWHTYRIPIHSVVARFTRQNTCFWLVIVVVVLLSEFLYRYKHIQAQHPNIIMILLTAFPELLLFGEPTKYFKHNIRL